MRNVEDELVLAMHSPPLMQDKAVTEWIAKLQSLFAEVRRTERRSKRGLDKKK